MQLETYITPRKYQSFRRKASTSTPSKGFTLIRRLLQTTISMIPTQFSTANFGDYHQRFPRWKPVASSQYSVIACYLDQLPTTCVPTLRSNTQYSFSHSRRNMLWCTQHAIRHPFTPRSVHYQKSLEPWLERTKPWPKGSTQYPSTQTHLHDAHIQTLRILVLDIFFQNQ